MPRTNQTQTQNQNQTQTQTQTQPLSITEALSLSLADASAHRAQLATLSMPEILAAMEAAAIQQAAEAKAQKAKAEAEKGWGCLTESQVQELERLHAVALRFRSPRATRAPQAWKTYRASRAPADNPYCPEFTSSGERIPAGFCPCARTTEQDRKRYAFTLLAAARLRVVGRLSIGDTLTLTAHTQAEFKSQAHLLDIMKDSLPGVPLRWSDETDKQLELDPKVTNLPEWLGLALFAAQAAAIIEPAAEHHDPEHEHDPEHQGPEQQ